MRLAQVALKDAPDEAEFGKRLVAFDRKLPRDRWLLGGEWDHDRTFNGQLPTAELIDKYVPDRPVFLRRYDGHMGVANTRALKLAGITAATADPTGGVIYRKPNSKEPTGVLRDNAMDLVDRLIPAPSGRGDRRGRQGGPGRGPAGRRHQRAGHGRQRRPTRRRLFRLYQQLARVGPADAARRPPLAAGAVGGSGEARRRGRFRQRLRPHRRRQGIRGRLARLEHGQDVRAVRQRAGQHRRLGDAAASSCGNGVIGADKAGLVGRRSTPSATRPTPSCSTSSRRRPRRTARATGAFASSTPSTCGREDYPRFTELGVIASMQPYHAIDDGRWAEGRIGANRCASSYALARCSRPARGWRSARTGRWRRSTPLLGIDAAVNRRTLDGKHPDGWFPEQKITVAEAIEAYTLGSAYAGFQEKDRGSLTAGKLADFVVLSRDILDPAERDHIAETAVLTTVVGGKVVYEKRD